LEKFAEKEGLKNFTITNNNDELEVEKGKGRELYVGTAVVVRDRRKLKKGEKRAALSYHFTGMRKMEDKPEEFGRFADAIRGIKFNWEQKMWTNYRDGYDVKKWAEKRDAIKRWNAPAQTLKPSQDFIPLHLVKNQYKIESNYSPF
jgi:hypothetical protein